MALTALSSTVGFLGAGNMATALVRGLVAGGLPPDRVTLLDVVHDKAAKLAAEVGAMSVESARALVERSDVVFVCVKPGVVPEVLAPLAELAERPLWISIAAGVPLARIEELLGGRARVVRAMPNTPALVRAGATGLSAGQLATSEDVALSRALLAAVGLTELIAEAQMDALTGLSGSGPAYVLLIIEALADGGVRAGLPRDAAQRLAAQTVLGAARLVLESGEHPATLKDAVASPGGTTIAGIEALEERGVRGALMHAVARATARARELGGR
jgi:pyrroline-5-carboxylate reductase